ncbi:uncharacterized protein LOC128204081 isoform X2 [Mya arenaria]|nr:uncharacterized protein LOC128204081 isoform X2 [Mya arenaria]XP_052761384.1 uncharacterized protein LOC128204081 isoform X2 [Mya arenaria]
MDRIVQNTLPPEAYPRYKQICQHVQRLNRKSHRLITKCGVRDDTNVLGFGEVVINVSSKGQGDPVDVRTLAYKPVDSSRIQRKTFNVEEFKTLNFSSFREGLKIPTIFVADYETFKANDFPSFFGRLIILVAENPVEDEHRSKANDVHIWISTKEKLSQNICNMLEMYALRHIRERTDILLTMTRGCNDQAYYHALQNCLGAQTIAMNSPVINPSTIRGDHHSVQTHRQYSRDSTVEEYLTVSKEAHTRLVDENKQSIRDLHGEIIAMYGRSNLPDNEKPKPRDIDHKVDKCIADAILQEIAGIKGLGYRFGTLNFYANSNILNEEEKQKLLLDINASLARLNIDVDNYVLRVGTHYESFSSNCKVGSKVFAIEGSFGTLGGFAEKTREGTTNMCVLTANHVVSNAENNVLKMIRPQGNLTLGEILPHQDSLQFSNPIDICATKVNTQLLKICETKQKNSDGNESESQVFDFATERISALTGELVYIWGATSSPGKGKIAMPEYFERHRRHLVGIEDEDSSDEEGNAASDKTTFATKGDSGAIICKDDIDSVHNKVVAISMLIGEQTNTHRQTVTLKESKTFQRQVSKSSTGSQSSASAEFQAENQVPRVDSTTAGKRVYLSFQLQAGLQQLNQVHESEFKLC